MTEPRDAVRNAADPEQVAKAGNRAKAAEFERLNRWATVMDTPSGRDVLAEILEYSGCDRTAIGGSNEMTHFLVGKQDVGFYITAQQKAARERLTPSPTPA